MEIDVWKIASRYSDRGIPESSVYPLFKKYSIAFVSKENGDIINDHIDSGNIALLAITDGKIIKAIGHVMHVGIVNDFVKDSELSDYSEELCYKIKFYELSTKDHIEYGQPQRFAHIDDKKIFKKINDLYVKYSGGKMIKEISELLKANKNIILTGAPGTGKTFLAKQISKEIVMENFHTDGLSTEIFTENFKPGQILKSLNNKKFSVVSVDTSKIIIKPENGKNEYSVSIEQVKKDLSNGCRQDVNEINSHGNATYIRGISLHLLDEIFKDNMNFVQFHPSYDYTDFVEGLRPRKDGDKEIGFELKNGIFKEFCKKAHKNYIDSKKEVGIISKEKWLDAIFSEFVYHVQKKIDEEDTEYLKLTDSAGIVLIDEDAFRYDGVNWNYPSSLRMKFNDLKLFYLHGVKGRQDILKLQDVNGLAKQHASYYFKVYEKFKSFLGNDLPPKDYKNSKVELKNYVFIIDEINRGEISKIFGELFFSIDPGYRGEKGKVKTQYANMQTDGTCFSDINYDYFYVPENVYIIGTMNDIDRSVESFDFAMRRRFVWREITAENSQMMFDTLDKDQYQFIIDNKTTILIKMNNLNNAIVATEGLNEHYKIGAAYFLKLQEYSEDPFDKLWDLHLKPLLHEYLRGMPDANNQLKLLKKAYDATADRQTSDN